MRQHFLTVRDHRLGVLCVNEGEEGPPLVLLHGITGAYTFWTHVLPPEIRDGRRWYSLTLPGHFPAMFPTGVSTGLAPAELGGLLDEALEEVLGEEPAVVMGHSTGGYAALVLAATVPERVRGVVSVSGFMRGRLLGTLGLMQWLAGRGPIGAALFRTLIRLSMLSPAIYKKALSLQAADRQAFMRSPITERMLQAIYPYVWRHDAESIRRFFLALRDVDLREVLPNIEVPVLLIAGKDDSVLPREQFEEMAALIPEGELHLIRGAGHMLFAERTPLFYRTLNTWLTRAISP